MTAPAIRITAQPKKSVQVELLGKVYSIKPPKSAMLLAIGSHIDKTDNVGALNTDFENILKLMFTNKKGQFEEIKARLADPADDLDLDHIFEVVEALVEEKTGNPTS